MKYIFTDPTTGLVLILLITENQLLPTHGTQQTKFRFSPKYISVIIKLRYIMYNKNTLVTIPNTECTRAVIITQYRTNINPPKAIFIIDLAWPIKM